MKKNISKLLSSIVLSESLQEAKRETYSIMRRVKRTPPIIRYFHQVDDPYSYLLIQALTEIVKQYNIVLLPFLVNPPDQINVPYPELLRKYALREVSEIAKVHGLTFSNKLNHCFDKKFDSANITRANAIIISAMQKGVNFLEIACLVGRAFWNLEDELLISLEKQYGSVSESNVEKILLQGHKIRHSLGHYLSGMLHFEGEWYWGVDRLPYLENRLLALQLNNRISDIKPKFGFKKLIFDELQPLQKPPTIEIFISFRSPYSWIGFFQIRKLAQHYHAQLKINYVLPMAMRGNIIGVNKRYYVLLDAQREAKRLSVPFGNFIIDSLGDAIHNTLAVLDYAIKLNCGEDFTEAVFRAIFVEGLDLSKKENLLPIAKSVGLTDKLFYEALENKDWIKTAEQNSAELFSTGLWGVPTFRVNGGEAYWGQDRLWMLENDLIKILKNNSAMEKEVIPTLRAKL